MRRSYPKNYIAMTMIDRLTTNMQMEAKAATSRIISVIGPLRCCYVLYMFSLYSRVNRILHDIESNIAGGRSAMLDRHPSGR